MLIILCVAINPAAHSQNVPSYQVKAAFVYNFSQFVKWPSNSFSSSNAPFVIGVLGTDPFGPYLSQLVAGERVEGRPIAIRVYNNITEIDDCHILFINVSNAADVLKHLKNKSILTVSDHESFARRGGMIRLFADKNKIKLQINPAAAKAANLSVSSKLLRLAEIVD